MLVRPAVAADAASIATIWHLGWRDGHLGHVPDEVLGLRDAESFSLRAPRRIDDTTVAEIDGRLAGFIMVVDDEAEQVYVSQEFRGSGVANVLLDEAERQVQANGHSTAWLSVVGGNTRARRFYERRGWIDKGVIDYQAATATGVTVTIPSHRYVKVIRNSESRR